MNRAFVSAPWRIPTLAAVVCLGLAACGGGGGGHGVATVGSTPQGTTSNPIPAQTNIPANVAVAAQGAYVAATYDAASAAYVNDGDTTGAYWVGDARNAAVTLALAKNYRLSGFTLYTNATNNIDTRVELSSDGEHYLPVSLTNPVVANSGEIYCSSFSMGSGKIWCGLESLPEASHVRVVITAAEADVPNTRIYELEVTGQ